MARKFVKDINDYYYVQFSSLYKNEIQEFLIYFRTECAKLCNQRLEHFSQLENGLLTNLNSVSEKLKESNAFIENALNQKLVTVEQISEWKQQIGALSVDETKEYVKKTEERYQDVVKCLIYLHLNNDFVNKSMVWIEFYQFEQQRIAEKKNIWNYESKVAEAEVKQEVENFIKRQKVNRLEKYF